MSSAYKALLKQHKRLTEDPFEKDVEEQKEEKQADKGEMELSAFKDSDAPKQWKNRQRTLVFCARGVNHRHRHLVGDLMKLMPHHKSEAKVDRKQTKDVVDELCFQRSCNNCLYFESRKKKDLFMWMLKSPSGPSAKFAVHNIHTTDELKLTGNCLSGSRPLLSFDSTFNSDESPHLKLLKEMINHSFGTPHYHPKSKPFVDHVFTFSYLNDRIWFRNYQIVNETEDQFTEKDDIEKLNLIEIGPRFCL